MGCVVAVILGVFLILKWVNILKVRARRRTPGSERLSAQPRGRA
jgi:hypothetical protein